ncbi:hypothetical protein G3475_15615 [Shewanella baltica]|nr:hypothetical protein [Shewanella baltica]
MGLTQVLLALGFILGFATRWASGIVIVTLVTHG